MEVIHVAQNSDGYEIVTLLANRISRTNSLILIQKGEQTFMSGGFILNNTKEIRTVLDSIPKEKQYEFVQSFKIDPFIKFYYDEK